MDMKKDARKLREGKAKQWKWPNIVTGQSMMIEKKCIHRKLRKKENDHPFPFSK